MKKTICFAIAALAGLSMLGATERGLMTVEDMIKSAQRKDTVIVKGTLKKQINFDQLTLNDGTGDVLIDFSRLRQHLKPGETVVVSGSYRGKLGLKSAKAEILALQFTTDLADGQKIIDARPAPSPLPTQAPSGSVESRLEQLEKLKSKGLISAEEYQEQRKRILADL